MHPVNDIDLVLRCRFDMILDTIAELRQEEQSYTTLRVGYLERAYIVSYTMENRCHMPHVLDGEDRIQHLALTTMHFPYSIPLVEQSEIVEQER